jgi:uncharacterized membrane protein
MQTYTPQVVSREFLSAFTAIAAVCFAGALLTDVAYVQSPDMQWANFSAWLLLVGIVASGLALVMAIIVFFRRRSRVLAAGWLYAIAAVIVMSLELLNNFIHSRDAWLSVWPTGLSLSVASAAIMVLAAALHLRNLKARYLEDQR